MFRSFLYRGRAPSAARGFTLYELLIAICIVGSVAAVGVSASDILRENEKSTAANQLVAYLALARNEAIKRHARVKLCPSADQRTCLDAGNDYTAWQAGWLLYTDDNHDGEPGAREILHVYAAAYKSLSIRTSRARD